MVVEISKEQKEMLSQKIALCVEFIKNEVQPHMVSKDKITFAMNPLLELIITSKDIYVNNSRVVSFLFWEPCFSKLFYLEKQERSKKKKYICEESPELAVEFLRCWGKAKEFLSNEVSVKITKVDSLNSFIDDFKL